MNLSTPSHTSIKHHTWCHVAHCNIKSFKMRLPKVPTSSKVVWCALLVCYTYFEACRIFIFVFTWTNNGLNCFFNTLVYLNINLVTLNHKQIIFIKELSVKKSSILVWHVFQSTSHNFKVNYFQMFTNSNKFTHVC